MLTCVESVCSMPSVEELHAVWSCWRQPRCTRSCASCARQPELADRAARVGGRASCVRLCVS
jgi:hypothetical protein